MGVPLGAVAEDGHGLAFEAGEVGVLVVDHGGRTLVVQRFEIASRLDAPAERVWARVSTFEGINDELRPLCDDLLQGSTGRHNLMQTPHISFRVRFGTRPGIGPSA